MSHDKIQFCVFKHGAGRRVTVIQYPSGNHLHGIVTEIVETQPDCLEPMILVDGEKLPRLVHGHVVLELIVK